MSPIVRVGGVNVHAHSLYVHVVLTSGRELAEELDVEVRDASRRGNLCAVAVGRKVYGDCDAAVVVRPS